MESRPSPDNDDHRAPAWTAFAEQVFLPAGSIVFYPGDACTQFMYLVSGSVRVDLVAASGKSVTLYRIGSGETCILTTACLLSDDAYNAEAQIEADATAFMISKAVFKRLMDESDEFRSAVFDSFAMRLSEMMAKVEEIAFISIDRRLAASMLRLATAQGIVIATHDELAVELGTAREVVSRKLGAWETAKLIERRRGEVRIADRLRLEALAKQGD